MHQPASTRPFDLVILDLDGTILDLYRASGISPEVAATIAAVQAAGVPVTIGTGRTLDYVRSYITAVHLTTPVVTTQGAVIGDPLTGHILHETTMPLDAARAVADWFDESRRVGVLYFTDDEGHIHIKQTHTSADPDFDDYVFGRHRQVVGTLHELLTGDHPHAPIKFMTINDTSVEEDLAPALKQRFAGVLSVTRTHPILVEGTAFGVDKGSGLRKLCDLLGISPARVLAIGDNDNDIPMLAAAGYAVAMGNATPGALAEADWVAPSIAEEGAAVALRKLVLDPIAA